MNKKLLKIIDFWIEQDGRLEATIESSYESLEIAFKRPQDIQRFLLATFEHYPQEDVIELLSKLLYEGGDKDDKS